VTTRNGGLAIFPCGCSHLKVGIGKCDLFNPDGTARSEVDGMTPCRECGCTELEPCVTDHGRCFWFDLDLCSACAGPSLWEDGVGPKRILSA